ncbi:unnamed protein product [Caenorhabditis bovis]|uniref:Dynein light chain n=1 Tax=Caenorhabditis bovis TaxID=2654633 RepID=A0A8S1ET52_9PELO|nr:unnamed protein product [Caenorhabditis bovis]
MKTLQLPGKSSVEEKKVDQPSVEPPQIIFSKSHEGNLIGKSMGSKKQDAIVRSTDMPEELQKEAITVSLEAMDKYKLERDIATYIKEEFDKRHNPSWHCVVGRNFGSYVTHESNNFIYFYIKHIAIMLFKTAF